MSAETLLKQILASNRNSVHFVNLSSKLDWLAKSAGRLPQITKEILCLPYQCRDTFINEKGEDTDNIIVDQDTYGNQWMYFWVSAYGNKITPKKQKFVINCPKRSVPVSSVTLQLFLDSSMDHDGGSPTNRSRRTIDLVSKCSF